MFGIICLHASGVSRLVGGRLLIPLSCQQIIPYNRLTEDEPSGSKYVVNIVQN